MQRLVAGVTAAVTLAAVSATAALAQTGAVGIIQVREEVDGAGPSNVFHLRDNVIALADPLKADIKAYDMRAKTALGACAVPRDFRPWRLVRSRDAVSIVDEAEQRVVDVPRAQTFGGGCRLDVRRYDGARDDHHRLRRVDNRTVAVPPRRGEAGANLTVRASAYELLSVRELERDAAGNRYALAKVLQPKAAARPGQLGVTVTVLRYDPRGRLNGAYRVPFENRKKRAFDYVAVLPAGDLVLALYDQASDQFRLDRIPMPFVAAASRNVIPANVPNATAQDGFEAETEALAVPHLAAPHVAAPPGPAAAPPRARLAPLSGPRMVVEARKYLDQEWEYRRPAGPMTAVGDGVFRWQVAGASRTWVQPAHHRGLADGARVRGLAYNYGGVDTPQMFLSKIRQGVPAGQLGDAIVAPGNTCAPNAPFTATAGIDCSALLARAWGFDTGCVNGARTFSTRSFESRHAAVCAAPVPSFAALKEGDAINLAGSHVVIFLRTESPDGASKMVRVLESASRCSGVCESRYDLDAFDGWILHRRTGRSDASCPRAS
jgi:hypothetical protein